VIAHGSGPIHLGRRTAEGGCPHMSCGGQRRAFPKREFSGIYFLLGILSGEGMHLNLIVVEIGAALVGRVFRLR